jgi:SAM-dependent methyltransferase
MGSAQVQGALWGRHARTWSTEMEPQLSPAFDALLDALEPLSGLRVLDAGCGAGLLARKAAERGAALTGLDASAALLEVARERVPDGDFRVGDIDSLPWDDGSFDVVTAFNSVQYATDPALAVAELARVCEHGGRIGIGIWGDPARCETDALFARLRSLAPPPPGTPAPLALSEAGVVESLLEKAGLQVGDGGEVTVSMTFRDLDHAWTAHTSAGPLQKVIDVAGEPAVRAVMDAVLEADRKPDGGLRQDNVFRYVLASKD